RLADSRRAAGDVDAVVARSEEHTSELQSRAQISYAVFCLKKKKTKKQKINLIISCIQNSNISYNSSLYIIFCLLISIFSFIVYISFFFFFFNDTATTEIYT